MIEAGAKGDWSKVHGHGGRTLIEPVLLAGGTDKDSMEAQHKIPHGSKRMDRDWRLCMCTFTHVIHRGGEYYLWLLLIGLIRTVSGAGREYFVVQCTSRKGLLG